MLAALWLAGSILEQCTPADDANYLETDTETAVLELFHLSRPNHMQKILRTIEWSKG